MPIISERELSLYKVKTTDNTIKAIANGPVDQVLAGPLFLKVKTKFYFTKSKY